MNRQLSALTAALALPLLTAACATAGPAAAPQDPPLTAEEMQGVASLEVRFNVEEKRGTIRGNLFMGKDNYYDDVAVEGAVADATSGVAVMTFTDLKPGEYAIKSYHDLNGDAQMNTNLFGIPSEPFAFSNDAPANFGPPSFDKAKFVVRPGENVHTINIR